MAPSSVPGSARRRGGRAAAPAVALIAPPADRAQACTMSVTRKIERDQHGEREGQPLDHRIVAAVDALDHQPPGAGDGEHRLGDDRAADQRADDEAEQRHRRDQRVAQHVAQQDQPRPQALGAGEVDIFRVQHAR